MSQFYEDGEELTQEERESEMARAMLFAGIKPPSPPQKKPTLAMMASAARKAQPKPRVTSGWWFPRAFMMGYSCDGDGWLSIYLGPGWVAFRGKQ